MEDGKRERLEAWNGILSLYPCPSLPHPQIETGVAKTGLPLRGVWGPSRGNIHPKPHTHLLSICEMWGVWDKHRVFLGAAYIASFSPQRQKQGEGDDTRWLLGPSHSVTCPALLSRWNRSAGLRRGFWSQTDPGSDPTSGTCELHDVGQVIRPF